MKLAEVLRITFDIEVVSGLQIRGSGGELEIGSAVDANLAIMRNPANNEPYIPGSSLKGKLRSCLEREKGVDDSGEPCRCGRMDCMVCVVFGAHRNPKAKTAPTRIVVRDAHFTETSRTKFHSREAEGRSGIEIKTENLVNRRTGAAESPHTGERVLPGDSFSGVILLNIFDSDHDRRQLMLDTVYHALGLIEETSSLGAGGSRGSGSVRFRSCQTVSLDLPQLRVC